MLRIAIAILGFSLARLPAPEALPPIYVQKSTKNTSEAICTETICIPAYSQECTAELESKISHLQLTISLSNYTLLLEGQIESGEQCTLLEQRVIVGKKDWNTPEMETTLRYAQTYPAWYPTQKILEEMKEKYPEQYEALSYDSTLGKYYVPAGGQNPLGKVKYVFDTPHLIFLHG
ncbi:L,D-transpeptidase, partial [Candidatus Woesearchaeota archaeon]|nr:L,D-transpeptidase [Candidatus Woesearchaeota archaeon]